MPAATNIELIFTSKLDSKTVRNLIRMTIKMTRSKAGAFRLGEEPGITKSPQMMTRQIGDSSRGRCVRSSICVVKRRITLCWNAWHRLPVESMVPIHGQRAIVYA
jgi:hypothetical protein